MSIQSLVYIGTHTATSTNLGVSLPAALPSVVNPVVESAQALSSHASPPSSASSVVAGVAGGSSNIDLRPSVGTGLVMEAGDFVSDLRPFVQPIAPADQPDPSVPTPGKACSKKKALSSGESRQTRMKLAVVSDRVKLKLPPSAGVRKKASLERSKLPSLTASTGPRHAQRVVLAKSNSCAVEIEEVLLIILKTSKSGNSHPAASLDDR